MREGAVVIVSLPQANGFVKNRPAVVLRQLPSHGDWLTCGISTQLQQQIPNFDETLDQQQSDFMTSGILQPSIIRLGFLAAIARHQILGSIGSISRELHARLLKNL